MKKKTSLAINTICLLMVGFEKVVAVCIESVQYGTTKFITTKHGILESPTSIAVDHLIINSNYVGTRIFSLTVLEEFESRYLPYKKVLNDALNEYGQSLGPLETNEYYSFGGDYNSDKILFNIKTVGNTTTLEVNNQVQSLKEVEILHAFLHLKFAQLEVQTGSFKIGQAIGPKAYLVSIIEKYLKLAGSKSV